MPLSFIVPQKDQRRENKKKYINGEINKKCEEEQAENKRERPDVDKFHVTVV